MNISSTIDSTSSNDSDYSNAFRASSSSISKVNLNGQLDLSNNEEEETENRDKKRKSRTTFTKSQLLILEREFDKRNFLTSEHLERLVSLTSLDARIIKVILLLIFIIIIFFFYFILFYFFNQSY
jgi:hypothetical protein